MELQIQIDAGTMHDVRLTRREGREPSLLQIDGHAHAASLRATGDAAEVCVDDRTERVWIAVERDAVFIHAFGQAWRLEVVNPAERGLSGADAADVYAAPMPGTVVTTTVRAGQAVTAGEPLLIIESMKMQSEIVAWRDGVVQRTPLRVGETFDRGAVLIEFAPVDPSADGAT
jgi:3-methylcrotonyl-CoA carboxylase alpha subunit